jgi:hypothetical protein
MSVFQLLMRPSNLVCDRLGLADEHERGMMRMLVNMGICTAICVLAGYVAWEVVM